MLNTLLIISIIIYFFSIIYIKIKLNNKKNLNIKSKKIKYISYFSFIILIIWCSDLLIKNIFNFEYILNANIKWKYFDYIVYICISFFFPTLNVLSYYYNNKKDNKLLYCIYIISALSSILLLMSSVYSNLFNISIILICVYSCINFIIFMIKTIVVVLNKIGSFSNYVFFIEFTYFITLLITVIFLLNIIDTMTYICILPILIYISLFIYINVMLSGKNFKIVNITLDTVTNSMSDSFVVVSNDGTILEYNATFLNTFKNIIDVENGDNFFDIIREKKIFNHEKLIKLILEVNEKIISRKKQVHLVYGKVDRYFDIDISPLLSDNKRKKCIGILLLIKDITQHKLDIKQIKQKQEVIVKQGQLASIGEVAGGVAHDINTPISAIKTGVTLLKSFDESRTDEQNEILNRIDNCADKIINIVNSMRNQIRNLGSKVNIEFKISSVLEDVKTITFHEIKKNNSILEINVLDDISIKGDPTKFGQVLTNLIVNSVQAYKDKGGKVIVTIDRTKNNKAIVKVVDFAGGLDKDIEPYIFKNILTTKGTFGTGLGLYVSYSVIKGEFNGDLVFNTEKGIGTTFIITIPVKENKKD